MKSFTASRAGLAFAFTCACLQLAAGPGYAQQADAGPSVPDAPDAAPAEAPAAAPVLLPPQVANRVEAVYPEAPLRDGRAGRVVLRVTVAADGSVTDVQVAEPAGHGFDEAASAALAQFRFTPATRDGSPVAARILYAYEFAPPTPASAPVPAAAAPVAAAQQPTPAAPPPPPSPAAFEATARTESAAVQLRESAQAVVVIETESEQREAADLGEVLARSTGVGVRRAGGLGSDTRFSLNGLTDDQIRFFLDGVPLELAGYPLGIANVPVNLVERIEVYRGVVPVTFGADALGGAVNLVTDDAIHGTHAAASYQAGSFGTQRVTALARHLHEPSGFFTRVTGFYDHADNDYPIDVEVPDERGRLSPATVYRFHDAYSAGGANLEAGFVDRSWADRLLLRGFVTSYDKELQHNVVMTVPYGEPTYGQLSSGASARYEHALSRAVSLDALGGYSFLRSQFVDLGECVYNWFGQCVRDRPVPGEIEARPHDRRLWDHSGYGRVNLTLRPAPQHTVRLSAAPTYLTRTGDERAQLDPTSRDPASARRDLLTLISGGEYELDAFDDRLQNVIFVKHYVQLAWAEEPLPGGVFRQVDRSSHRGGLGDALRFRFTDYLYAKLSYELATRLPRSDEIFGNGMLIRENLGIEPEVSHNGNLGATLDLDAGSPGRFRMDLNGFVREADQLIVLLGSDRFFMYDNVYSARSLGVEAAAGWTSPRDYVTLDSNVTYVDLRNTSTEGTFADFEGDRVPNRPYLFSNASARFALDAVAVSDDTLSLTWYTRYVHEFYRGWESVGLREYKQVVPSQFLHSVALTYLVDGEPAVLGFTAELENLTDTKAYDFFGVQRPGRAFYFKVTAEL
jgi:vitamin B12 transporter